MNFGNRGGHTIRITYTIKATGEQKTILTGTSYKDWWTQATEFFYRREFVDTTKGWNFKTLSEAITIDEVEKSHSAWIGWGGLKWCTEDLIQGELNREGVQRDEPDNPKPRQYANFVFDYYPAGYRKLMKELKGW